jgi:putative spermidine/putrescine transport system permease protein
VALPLAVPGIAVSSLLAFLYSLDEFTGALLIGSPFVKTLPVQMYLASMGYEMQIASVTSLIITIPGIGKQQLNGQGDFSSNIFLALSLYDKPMCL